MSQIFKNKDLIESINKSKDIFNANKNMLNDISNDIKNLEIFLREMNVQVSYEKDYQINNSLYKLIWDGHRLNCCIIYPPQYDNYNQSHIIEKPLIEHKIKVRINLYEKLNDFVEYIKNNLFKFEEEE